MPPPAPRPQRFPQVDDCAWTDPGRCRRSNCRYSLLAERPHITDWAPEDLAELAAALPSTCAIELASLGPMRLDEISAFLGVPRPQVEQIELQATRKLTRLHELRRAHWDSR